MILHQPWASLVALGVKQWETRGAPPNGSMRPAGVRGMPGLGIEPGERIAICAGAKRPDEMLRLGPQTDVVTEEFLVVRGHLHDLCNSRTYWLRLGRVVCTAVVAEALPMVGDYDDVCSAYEGPAAIEVTPSGRLIRYPAWGGALDWEDMTDLTDQLPYGDWQPGRWAWRLTDVQPADGPIEVVRGNRQGVFEAAVTW